MECADVINDLIEWPLGRESYGISSPGPTGKPKSRHVACVVFELAQATIFIDGRTFISTSSMLIRWNSQDYSARRPCAAVKRRAIHTLAYCRCCNSPLTLYLRSALPYGRAELSTLRCAVKSPNQVTVAKTEDRRNHCKLNRVIGYRGCSEPEGGLPTADEEMSMQDSRKKIRVRALQASEWAFKVHRLSIRPPSQTGRPVNS